MRQLLASLTIFQQVNLNTRQEKEVEAAAAMKVDERMKMMRKQKEQDVIICKFSSYSDE